MSFIKVQWIHDDEDDPIFYFCELDMERYESRRVEVFKDGRHVSMDHAAMDALQPLEVYPVPAIDELNSMGPFRAEEIGSQEFERVWKLGL